MELATTEFHPFVDYTLIPHFEDDIHLPYGSQQGVILQDDDSSDELEIEKEQILRAFHIRTIEKLPSLWNMEKVAAGLKNKKVEVTKRATKSNQPLKACFKCGKEGHLIKQCKQVNETNSSHSK
ncbi:hypothetical protein L1987_23426 [Smallanthus sonchifolius]|uniref:Uncharacterized protein n=1 Tax=Smallanthus sonchifolius TaxID=185202 RepID=A0ACB9IJ41_9ASTR|nr:hypothetical protein L1987_23426 [Smallanthus sonchifolius]